MEASRLLMKRLKNVRTAMTLIVLAYNPTPMMNSRHHLSDRNTAAKCRFRKCCAC